MSSGSGGCAWGARGSGGARSEGESGAGEVDRCDRWPSSGVLLSAWGRALFLAGRKKKRRKVKCCKKRGPESTSGLQAPAKHLSRQIFRLTPLTRASTLLQTSDPTHFHPLGELTSCENSSPFFFSGKKRSLEIRARISRRASSSSCPAISTSMIPAQTPANGLV